MNNSWTIPQKTFWSIPEANNKPKGQKIPHHLRLRDHFAGEIENGALSPGSRLPPERNLAEQLDITRITLRQALGRLEAEGLIFRQERRGWFVSPPRVLYDPTANASFTQSIAQQGRVASTKVLAVESAKASLNESRLLNCKVGEPIFIINRVRTVDGRPILVERIQIIASRCKGLTDFELDGSLTALMAEKFDIIEQRVQISMRPTAISEVAAKELGVAVGTPGLYLIRKILDQNDDVVEIDEEFWRHDAIEICISATGAPAQTSDQQDPVDIIKDNKEHVSS